MHLGIAFLGLLALAASTPITHKHHAADEELLHKQQDVIHLLENIIGEMPDHRLWKLGHDWDLSDHIDDFENPSAVKELVFLHSVGHLQPRDTVFSLSIGQLRHEAALLVQILIGAQDYETFLGTAAWARVHLNQDQFVKAFSGAVLTRPDLHGIVLPAPYEVFPHYFFQGHIVQHVQDYVHLHGSEDKVHHVWLNDSSHDWTHRHHQHHQHDHKIAHFTEDIGLSAYYAYVSLAGFMVPSHQHHHQHVHQDAEHQHVHLKNGHGAHYHYIHHQLMARYNLERLAQGLEPVHQLDDYYEHIETPFHSGLRHFSGVHLPGRGEHIYVTPHHHQYHLVKLVRTLEHRILEAIDSGHVITAQGAFLSLYQPQGINILGELIEGTGRSLNPRYYGAFAQVARQLYGQAPEFHNIWEHVPAPVELGMTCVRDPAFWQLYAKILEFFHHYSMALPARHYPDVVLPGVSIDKIVIGDLHTHYSDFEVILDNVVEQPVHHHEHEEVDEEEQVQDEIHHEVHLHVPRLDHKAYEYTIHVSSKKVIPGAVVRVFIGPKYNYDGQLIDYNEHRHYFYEIDQFYWDLIEGHNVIVRNSNLATGHSFDWPSISQIKSHVNSALHSENPFYITHPQQLFGFPERLSIPKGTHDGFPIQMFVVISSGIQHQAEHWGPVVEDNWQTYQPDHYQVLGIEEYQHLSRHPIDKLHGGHITVDVVPEEDATLIYDGPFHWGYLYKKYPGSYVYPHHDEVHGKVEEEVHHHHHRDEDEHEHEDEAPDNEVDENEEEEDEDEMDEEDEDYGWDEYQSGNWSPAGKQRRRPKPAMIPHALQLLRQRLAIGGSGLPHQQEIVHHAHEEQLHEYYEGKHISDVIGGVVSLDGKPLGWPFDRPLGPSVLYAHNVHVHDLHVYHHDHDDEIVHVEMKKKKK